jgi:hypothetical protein
MQASKLIVFKQGLTSYSPVIFTLISSTRLMHRDSKKPLWHIEWSFSWA